MVDIHAHVLPGVDDGAASLEEGVEMCHAAAREGVTVVVATPHQRHERWPNSDRGQLERLWRDLEAAVGPAPRVLLGAELAVDSELLGEIEGPPGGSPLPLAGSRYLLLEPSPVRVGSDLAGLIHELRVGGWFPVLAHPERVGWLAEDPPLLEDLAEAGALFQLTAMSVSGRLGRRVQARCRTFLDGGWAHFVASDMHDTVRRPPGLVEAYDEIAGRWGDVVARTLMIENPQAVIEDRPLSFPEPADDSWAARV